MAPVLTHLALHVRDLEACVAFYRDYCQLEQVHQRGAEAERVVWLAEAGRERELVLVLIPGGPGRDQAADDFSHLGFALASRAAVDAVAAKAEAAGLLVWPSREEPYPVGYYCGVRDPDGHMVEFSHGQPLGPGAPDLGAEDLGEGPRPTKS
jgi:catechol 2,3-dioxygenase-like lactoylglutathione lyase family enzyme